MLFYFCILTIIITIIIIIIQRNKVIRLSTASRPATDAIKVALGRVASEGLGRMST